MVKANWVLRKRSESSTTEVVNNTRENDDKRFRSNPEEKGWYNKHNAHLVDAAKSDSKCYFCDENENRIASNEPKGSKIAQYFACQKSTEMTPIERFQLLRKKGYCIQFLFPGA